MKAEEILKSDVLDILFEDRNKNYGAYELRRNYAGRLQKALGICASFLLVVLTTGFVMAKSSKIERSEEVYRTIELVDVPKEEQPIVEPPKPQVEQPQVATIANSVPLIVKENIETEVPTQDEMETKVIGSVTQTGREDENNLGQAPLPESTGGEEPPIRETPKEDYDKKFHSVEMMPSYPGGTEALIKFLLRNLKSPSDIDGSVQVVIQFVVGKDGSITDLVISKSGGKEFDKEVERVVKMMPNWIPGQQNGHPVAVYFNLPVTFAPEAE